MPTGSYSDHLKGFTASPLHSNGQSTIRPGRQEAWKVIGHVPVVNFFYGGIRAAVYASKNNMAEAHSGALAMIPFAHNIIHGVIPAATKKAIEHAKNFLRQKEDQLRREYWMETWRNREWQERL